MDNLPLSHEGIWGSYGFPFILKEMEENDILPNKSD